LRPAAILPRHFVLVTCLCLTRNRRNWLPQAIACFESQTYPDRELLIVADGDDVSDLVPQDPRIRLIVTGPFPNIGAKRNWANVQAKGEIIAHWDDDDHSAPGRLAGQMTRLQVSGKAVTGYQSMKFTDGTSWWLYTGNAAIAMGTSLCYRRAWWMAHPFPAQQIGEDATFVGLAAQEQELVTEGDLNLMYATIHPGNSCARQPGSGPPWSELPGYRWGQA